MLYEMTKHDMKKGLKGVLINYLEDKSNLEDFRKEWVKIIVFFNVWQHIQVDYKGLRD